MLDYRKGIKKFKVHTLGCKVNQYDSQVVREGLSYAGLHQALKGDYADICVINTCTVTSRADTKSRQLIKKAIKDNPKAKIAVTGCCVQDNAELLRRIKGVDLIVGNDRRGKLLDLIEPSSQQPDKFLPIRNFDDRTRAFVKIQDGCDNFCSYCKVPYVRGRSRSREIEDIKKEIQGLVENGFREIVLCGICLGEFGRASSSRTNLVKLIEELEKIPNLKRIRLSSIEAKDITAPLIRKIASSDKLCKHLHIPFQSGDDKILKLMNRHYAYDYYMDVVEKIKQSIKDVAITTDVIVGFPGESDKNFKNTIELLKKVVPLRTHIFPFSARIGTKAYSLEGKVRDHIIKERTSVLKSITTDLSFLYRRSFLNEESEVLIESSLDIKSDSFCGYSSNYMKILIDKYSLNKNCINGFTKVKIIKVDKENTWAEPLFKACRV